MIKKLFPIFVFIAVALVCSAGSAAAQSISLNMEEAANGSATARISVLS